MDRDYRKELNENKVKYNEARNKFQKEKQEVEVFSDLKRKAELQGCTPEYIESIQKLINFCQNNVLKYGTKVQEIQQQRDNIKRAWHVNLIERGNDVGEKVTNTPTSESLFNCERRIAQKELERRMKPTLSPLQEKVVVTEGSSHAKMMASMPQQNSNAQNIYLNKVANLVRYNTPARLYDENDDTYLAKFEKGLMPLVMKKLLQSPGNTELQAAFKYLKTRPNERGEIIGSQQANAVTSTSGCSNDSLLAAGLLELKEKMLDKLVSRVNKNKKSLKELKGKMLKQLDLMIEIKEQILELSRSGNPKVISEIEERQRMLEELKSEYKASEESLERKEQRIDSDMQNIKQLRAEINEAPDNEADFDESNPTSYRFG